MHLGLEAQRLAPALRLGVDATEVRAKKEQDTKWQQVIDSALRLQKAARTGEAIAGDAIDSLTLGAAATEALQVGDETYLLLTGVRDLAAVPASPVASIATQPEIEPAAQDQPPPEVVDAEASEPTVGADGWATPQDDAVFAEPEEINGGWARPQEPVAAAEREPVVAVEPEPEVAAEQEVALTQPTAATATAQQPIARWGGTLIGRDMHLADLRARFDRVVAERTGACVLIAGEHGSGRTRLVRELAASLEGARTLTVRCAPANGGGARWPLAAIVETVAGLDALVPAEPARARLAELFAGEPDGDQVVPHLSAMLGLDGVAEADRVRWALRRLIEVASDGAPTLFHIDDGDRAGAGFLRLLADVAIAVRDVPILFAITTTGEGDGIPAIGLGPLIDADVAAMITDLLGEVETGVDTAIAARLNGTPFAVEQVLALLIESGTLAPGQGRWMPLADLGRVPIPDTTAGSIRQRLQALPTHELVVLGMAAVAGERFDVAPLLEVVPGDARAGVPASLEDLVARGFLIGGPDIYTFRHALLREATLPGVPDWARATTHERFARYLEAQAGDRAKRFADEIGSHLEASCRTRPEAPADDRTDAMTHLLSAADAAVDQGDLDGAARLERLASTLTQDETGRRAELLYLAAEHGALADPDRPADREVAEAALAASGTDDDVDRRVRLLRARLRTLDAQDDALENARAVADEAIAAAPDDERSWALASAGRSRDWCTPHARRTDWLPSISATLRTMRRP